MPNTERIIQLANEINSAVRISETIGEDVFNKSVFRSIPIPGLFKSTDYASHLQTTRKFVLKLKFAHQEIENLAKIANPSEKYFLVALSAYTTSLINVFEKIKIVVTGLFNKTQGRDYDLADYRRDTANYKAAVSTHLPLGKPLNNLFQKIGN